MTPVVRALALKPAAALGAVGPVGPGARVRIDVPGAVAKGGPVDRVDLAIAKI